MTGRAGGFGLGLAGVEAWEQVKSRPAVWLVTGLMAALAGAMVVYASAGEVAGLTREQSALEDAGRYGYTVQNRDGAGVPAARCDQLTAVDGVEAAGGVMSSERVVLEQDRSQGLTAVEATPGYLNVVWPTVQGTDAVAGAGTAEHFGLVPGARITLDRPRAGRLNVAVGEVAPASTREPARDNAVIVPATAQGLVPNCYVIAAPGAYDSVGALLTGHFSPTQVVVGPFTAQVRQVVDPDERLDRRSSRTLPLAAAGALVVLHGIVALMVRGEAAIYRLSGITWAGSATMCLVRWVAMVLLPAAMGTGVAVIALAPEMTAPAVVHLAWLDSARFFLLLPVAAVASFATWLFLRPLAALKSA
jgi:hypothetical protein